MDSKTIKHISSLARISLTEREEEKIKDDLSSILKYVEQLNEVDTSTTEPLHHVAGLINSMRTDDYRGNFKMDENLNEKLIGQAPDKKDRFVKVKSVLNK